MNLVILYAIGAVLRIWTSDLLFSYYLLNTIIGIINNFYMIWYRLFLYQVQE